MNKGKYVFAEITDFLPRRIFDRLVSKCQGNKHVREFTCWHQLLCMLFGQLSHRESLRDLVISIQAHRSKSYHLGFGKGVYLPTLTKANSIRDYRIYEEFAMHLIDIARKKNASSEFEIGVDGNIYAFDSSMIDVCLNVFWWATYKQNSGTVKLHTLYDIKTHIPCLIHITEASVNDIIAYCIVSIIAKDLKTDLSIYEILQIIGISLLDKTPIKELLTNTDYKNVKEQDDILLLFN